MAYQLEIRNRTAKVFADLSASVTVADGYLTVRATGSDRILFLYMFRPGEHAIFNYNDDGPASLKVQIDE